MSNQSVKSEQTDSDNGEVPAKYRRLSTSGDENIGSVDDESDEYYDEQEDELSIENSTIIISDDDSSGSRTSDDSQNCSQNNNNDNKNNERNEKKNHTVNGNETNSECNSNSTSGDEEDQKDEHNILKEKRSNTNNKNNNKSEELAKSEESEDETSDTKSSSASNDDDDDDGPGDSEHFDADDESDSYDDDEHKLQIDDCDNLSNGGTSTSASVHSARRTSIEKPSNTVNSDSDDDESKKSTSSSGSGSGSGKESEDNDNTSGSYKSCSSNVNVVSTIKAVLLNSIESSKAEDSTDSETESTSGKYRSDNAENTTTTPQKSPIHNVDSAMKLRRFNRIPVYIVEYHDQILEFVYRTIGSRHMPISDNILLHFDSHPDMVISRDLRACDTYNKSAMLQQSSIENWIMPLCYSGIINRIVWIKNPWCHQIPVGKYEFKIGSKDDKLYADIPLVYFLSEGNYCDTSQLKQARSIELFVIDAEAFDANLPLNSNDMSIEIPNLYNFLNNTKGRENERVPFILDIDLDFFSTTNPFLKLYSTSQCYQHLAEIFAFENDASIVHCDPAAVNERRIQKLETLKSIFNHLENYNSLDDYVPTSDITPLSKVEFGIVEQFVKKVRQHYPDERINWMLIYDAGCTADSGGLPHHISTDFELQQYYTRFRRFLKYLPYAPTIITISRSSEDEYCPPNQVEDIQVTILDCLEIQLGDQMHNDAIFAYLEEDYNIMEL